VSRAKPILEAPPIAGSSAETATFSAVGTASAETLTDSKLVPVLRRTLDPNSCTCYRCQAAVASPIPQRCAPAELSNGRWSVDGAMVEVRDSWLGRRVVMELPGFVGTLVVQPLRLWPRTKVLLGFAAVVLAAMAAMVAFSSNAIASTSLVGFLGFATAGIGCWLCWFQPARPDADDIAVDTAWRELVPRIQDDRALAATCLASMGKGTPALRVKPLRLLVEKVADRVPLGAANLQLLAVARILQAIDTVELGTDKACGVVAVFDPFFEGELAAAYAEAAARTILDSEILPAGERQRLRVLLIAAAFDSGFHPGDFPKLFRPFRNLLSLIGPLEEEQLCELYAVWRGMPPDAGENNGRATTVFELAWRSPGAARKLLGRWPDLLLRIHLPEHLRKSVGEVVLTPRGLFLDDLLIEDDDSTFGIERSPTGSGWYIAVGHQKVSVDRKPSGKITETLAAWLECRRTKLLAAVPKPGNSNTVKLREFLAAAVAECPQCGARNIVVPGEAGIEP